MSKGYEESILSNLENVKAGMILKNYKELCKLFGLDVKTSNAKKAQLKEIERFVKLDKNGTKYIISEKYEVVLPPNNNITQYIPLIEQLILHLIIEESDHNNRLYIRKNELLKNLKMINERYAIMKYKQLQLSVTNNIPIDTVKDFYRSSDDMLNRNIEQALKNLTNRFLIHWSNVYSVCEIVTDNDKYLTIEMEEYTSRYGDVSYEPTINSKLKRTHREATEAETKDILRIQNEVMHSLNCSTLSEIYEQGYKYEFYNKVNSILLDKYNIERFYMSYSIVYNIDHVVNRYEKASVFLLDDSNKEMIEAMLNDEVVRNVIRLGENRSNKANKGLVNVDIDTTLTRISEDYVDDIITLSDKLIRNKN